MADVLPLNRTCPFDPPPELKTYREQEPLRRLRFADGHLGWLATSHELARAVLGDRRFSTRMELLRWPVQTSSFPFGQPAYPGWFLFMDDPEHSRLRRPFLAELTVRRMKEFEPRITEIVETHLDAMAQASPPVDLVQEFALPIPSLAICVLLGVPYADRADFQRNSAAVLSLGDNAEAVADAMQALGEYMYGLVLRKRAEPTDDVLSGLVQGGQMSDEEIVGAGVMMLIGGHETTANMLALGTYALLEHPEQADALREGTVIPDDAVEELMRYLTVGQMAGVRTALEDVELGGELIKKGETVSVSLPAANRDPARFENPDQLDLSRPAGGHVAFGYGIHQCVGQQLARIEMRTALPALLRRFPALRLAVPPEQLRMREDMQVYGAYELPVAW